MLTLVEVLNGFPVDVLTRYDFSSAVYVSALKPISGIRCHIHGEFQQYSGQLRKEGGAGCPKCGDQIRRMKRRASQSDVVKSAIERHGGRYTYDRAIYVNSSTKFIVTCPDHGDFLTAPNNHISGGKGCPVCGAAKRGQRLTCPKDIARRIAEAKISQHAEKFVAQAREVHGDLYDYSDAVYMGRRKPITIICKAHGPFQQAPGHHLGREHGCPECSHHRSKGEAGIAKFVSIFGIQSVRDRSVIGPKELDVYLPDKALAIEYCGEYWHGCSNPEEERATKNRHLDKHRACEEKGIRLLTIYESEWLARPAPIKRLIRNAMGKGRGRVMARKCELRQVGHEEAARFFESYHPQGGGGYGEHYGLYLRTKLVACMRFTMGGNDRGAHAEREWTLSRYATRIGVTGGASRLFTAFLNARDPESVKSFSDSRYFAGGMYTSLGFVMESESAPDYQVYHPKTGLLPKTSWQRRNIPARIRDVGGKQTFDPQTDPRSERDMTYLLGAQRIFDCGKKRWRWRKVSSD